MAENDYSEKPYAEFTPQDWQSYWTKEVNAAKKWFQTWHAQGRKIEQEYLGESADEKLQGDARNNIFWSNVQVILSSLFSKLPDPEVDRTHLDPADDVARVAGLMLERIFELENKNYVESPKDRIKMALQDRFVPGLGVVWARFSFKEQQQQVPPVVAPNGFELAPAGIKILITDESAPLDYVRWDDLIYSPCRYWEELRWIGRRVLMNKRKLIDRFGKELADKVPMKTYNAKSLAPNDPLRQSPESLGEVLEIWCKDHGAVYWFCTGMDQILETKPDPLKVDGFYPTPKFLLATHVTSAYLPKPDYTMVKSQYAELNLIAQRLQLLTEAIRVVGIYDKASEPVKQILNQAAFNQMIPTDNWAMFAEKGGIKGQVDWFPLEMVVNTLDKLTQRKAALLQEIYEVLGLSDIMRGMSVASETATAQQLKAQFGSARMQRVQTEIGEFVSGIYRIRGQIICNHWQPQTIIERSQILTTPDAQFAEQAVMLLKNSPQVALKLSVQSDTMAAPDWNSEKQQRIDFLQATSQFIGMSMPLIQQSPGAGTYLIQMLQWATTGFKAGKQIEGVLDQAMQALSKDLGVPKPPPPPTPEDKKNLAAAGKSQAEAKQKNLQSMAMLRQAGYPPNVLAMVPPGQGPENDPIANPPGVQAPPGQGGVGRPPQTALPQGGGQPQ